MPLAALDDRNAKMSLLRRQFLDRAAADAEAIKGLLNQIDDSGILALRSLCHMLKGSASLLGFQALMNSAVVLHREIRERPHDRQSIMEKWTCLLGDLAQSGSHAG